MPDRRHSQRFFFKKNPLCRVPGQVALGKELKKLKKNLCRVPDRGHSAKGGFNLPAQPAHTHHIHAPAPCPRPRQRRPRPRRRRWRRKRGGQARRTPRALHRTPARCAARQAAGQRRQEVIVVVDVHAARYVIWNELLD